MDAVFGAYAAQWFMIVTWLPSFAIEHMGLSLSQASWLTALATFSNVAGNLSARPLANAGVPRWVLIAGVQVLLGSLGLAVFSAGLEPELRLLAALAAAGGSGILPATVLAGVPLHARGSVEVALANGIVVQCINIGAFLGPPAIAALVAHFGGWSTGRWLFPAIAPAGVAIAVALGRLEKRVIAGAPAGTAS